MRTQGKRAIRSKRDRQVESSPGYCDTDFDAGVFTPVALIAVQAFFSLCSRRITRSSILIGRLPCRQTNLVIAIGTFPHALTMAEIEKKEPNTVIAVYCIKAP